MDEQFWIFARMVCLFGNLVTSDDVKESPQIVAHVLFRTRICEGKSIHS